MFAERSLRVRRLIAAVVASVLAGSVVTACDQPRRDAEPTVAGTLVPDTIWVDNAWVRAGASGAITGAYVTVHNPLDSAVQIVGARSALADTVELHETMQHDGMVHMEPKSAVLLPARDSVMFALGGKHLMLRGLRRALAEGEQIPMQLLLNNNDSISFVVAVRSITGQ